MTDPLSEKLIKLGEASSAIAQCTAILGDARTNAMLAAIDAVRAELTGQAALWPEKPDA